MDATEPFINQSKEYFKTPESKPVEGEEGGQEEEAKGEELAPIGNLPDLRSDACTF